MTLSEKKHGRKLDRILHFPAELWLQVKTASIHPSSIHSSIVHPSIFYHSLYCLQWFTSLLWFPCLCQRLLLPHRSQSSQRTLMGSALITQLSSIDWSFSWPICKVLRLLSHSCNCQQLPQWQCWRVRALLPLCLPGSVKRASQSHRFARDNEYKENLNERGKYRRPTRLWI